MTKILNMTPHIINVEVSNGSHIEKISPDGEVWRLKEEVIFDQTIEYDNFPFSVYKKTFKPPELPAEIEGTYYIVSLIVKQAFPARKDLLVPDTGATAVRGSDGQIRYVTRFI